MKQIISRRGVVLPLALFALLFLSAMRVADKDYSFYLSTSKVFSPGDEVTFQLETYNLSGTIKLRVYQIDDPVKFFQKQRNPHHPDLRSLNETSIFKIFGEAANKIQRDARQIARAYMKAESRVNIRDMAGIEKAEEKKAAEEQQKVPKELEGYKIVKEWTEQIIKTKEWWNYQTVRADIKEAGVYLVEGRALDKVAYTMLVISKCGMVTKRSGTKLVAYVVDKKTGEPISDFELSFYEKNKKIGKGTTDKKGLYTLTIEKKEQATPTEEEGEEFDWEYGGGNILIMGIKDGNLVISDPYYYSYDREQGYYVYVYTERPVYRPGQDVFFKGIVRKKDDEGQLVNFPNQLVKITVTDSRGSVVYKDSMKTNEFGSFHGSLRLAEEPPLGFYNIQTVVENRTYTNNFEVQEYKKPEYKVEVAFDKDHYAKGDVIKATVKADYYFGSPVTNADVEYYIYRSRYWRPWWKGTDYAWYYEEDEEYYTYRQELLDSGTGKVDNNGRFELTYYTDVKAREDYVYRIQANVIDNSRRAISGAKSVEVTRGLFYISSQTDKYVYKPKEDVRLKVRIADFKENGVMANFAVKVIRQWWDRTEYWDNNVKRYNYQHHEQEVMTLSSATNRDGSGTVNFSVQENGYYRLVVSARDSRNNYIDETSYLYVTDERYYAYWGEESAKIQIIPDKDSYTAGETMHALIVLPTSGIDALVTVEGEDILDQNVERFDGVSKVIDVKLKDNYRPNIYLSVSTLFNDNFYNQSKRVLIIPQEKFLNVEILNDKQTYKPQDQGELTVKVTDENGRSVRNAEVSVGVVDESVYAISPERTTDIKKFFYNIRYNSVQTSSSLFFNFYGYSRGLRKEEYSDNKKAGEAAPLMATRSERERIALGDVKGQLFMEPATRREFKDMMLWQPTLVTDGNGIAKVQVKYPDNLTTWRATVRAMTRETEVGSEISRVIARKNLIVRMETPRFFMQKDELLIATIVHNYLSEDKQTKVSLSATNLNVEGTEKIITVPRNGEVKIDWKVRTSSPGEAKLLAKALTNEESDAMEVKVPVLPHGLQIAEAQVIDIDANREVKTATVNIPQAVDLSSAQFYVSISPSLASSILGALDDLIGYPYGCVEQTMSRFLPTVIVANTMRDLNVPLAEDVKKEIPKMVEKGLKRLYNFQHEDGGWGWWENDQSDPFMTAYVVYGLSLAKRANYEIPENVISKGIWNLKGHLESTVKLDPTTHAYVIYVMTFANEQEKVLEKSIIDGQLARFDTRGINNYARSLLALASYHQGDKATAMTLVNQLEAGTTSTGTAIYWTGKSWHYNWQDDAVETTAFALKALIEMKGNSDLIRKGVHWLLSQRHGFSWNSTRQTAIIIFALADYLKNSKELQPNYLTKVYVNDQMVMEKKVTQDDVFSKEARVKVNGRSLRQGENRIRVEKYGDGKLYFTSRVMYYSADENIQPKSAGFKVTREYFKLVKQRRSEEIVYVKQPFTGTVKSGDEIFVKLHIYSDDNYEYFMLEDPLPSGCEVIRKTDGYKIADEDGYSGGEYYGWRWWWEERDVRDEKVAFFARYFYSGEHAFTYIVRAQIPGNYHVMPSLASLMYYPEVRGNANEVSLDITE